MDTSSSNILVFTASDARKFSTKTSRKRVEDICQEVFEHIREEASDGAWETHYEFDKKDEKFFPQVKKVLNENGYDVSASYAGGSEGQLAFFIKWALDEKKSS